MRVVLDTNVLVSALMQPRGTPAIILALALRGDLDLCVSPLILAEYERVLRRPELKLNPQEVEATIKGIRDGSHMFRPHHRLTISPDESDNQFYECVDAANADYLVTGNKRHFPKAHGNAAIVTPRRFLDILIGLGPDL